MDSDWPQGALAIDAMGGDLGSSEVVEAVSLALKEYKDLQTVYLVGREDELHQHLKTTGLAGDSRVVVEHAEQVIGMDEKPIQSIKQKKDSSMLRAIELVKARKARGVLSCGNTGSLMAAGTIRLRTSKGVERPALGVIMPSKDHHFVMIDAGANPEARPMHLVHNAILGANYCRVALEVEKPRVGVLSIGTEEGKGNELVHEVHRMLKRLDSEAKGGPMFDYQGLIEGFQLFENHVDVIVCDGFVGNILLKTSESLFYVLKGYLKEELMKTPWRMAGAFLCRDAFSDMKSQLDPQAYGGAPLLGLRGLVMKAHGSSNRIAIKSAMGIATQFFKRDMTERVEIDIEQANQILKPAVEVVSVTDS